MNQRHPPGVRICFEGAGIIGALTRSTSKSNRPVGLMDKASASGAGDSRLESWAGHFVGLEFGDVGRRLASQMATRGAEGA